MRLDGPSRASTGWTRSLERWNSGSLYNPDDGQTYRVSAKLRSADVLVARIYLGVPPFGETKTLQWIAGLGLDGRCWR